jgi:uncharacterized damage-inducible protein DinB
MHPQQLLADYSRGPDALQQALLGFADDQADTIPIANTWSVRQVVCHLADAEIVYADRMKRVLIEDNPTIFGWSPDDSVNDTFCSHREIDDELALIASIRRHIASILEHQEVETWQRTAVHSEDGPMTLETLLERITEHIPHHVKFIEQKRAVLKSV